MHTILVVNAYTLAVEFHKIGCYLAAGSPLNHTNYPYWPIYMPLIITSTLRPIILSFVKSGAIERIDAKLQTIN